MRWRNVIGSRDSMLWASIEESQPSLIRCSAGLRSRPPWHLLAGILTRSDSSSRPSRRHRAGCSTFPLARPTTPARPTGQRERWISWTALNFPCFPSAAGMRRREGYGAARPPYCLDGWRPKEAISWRVIVALFLRAPAEGKFRPRISTLWNGPRSRGSLRRRLAHVTDEPNSRMRRAQRETRSLISNPSTTLTSHVSDHSHVTIEATGLTRE